MIHNNREVGVAQEVNCKAKKCKKRSLLFVPIGRREWSTRVPAVLFIWYLTNLEKKVKCSPWHWPSRQKNLSHLISSLPSQSPIDRNASGLRPAPRNSRNWQRKPVIELFSFPNMWHTLSCLCKRPRRRGRRELWQALAPPLFVFFNKICNSTSVWWGSRGLYSFQKLSFS